MCVKRPGFIANSSPPVIVVEMSEKRDTHTEEQQTKARPWQPTRRWTRKWVWWAIGMAVALVALVLLVVNLYPGIREDLLKERVLTLMGIVVALTVIIVLLALGGASLGWTGFGGQKLWDWLQLLSALAIPIVLAAAGFWFTAQQNENQRAIEDQRAEAEQKLAEQRAQDEALQAYLDQMSHLMLEKNLPDSEEGSPVRVLAQARTLTVLERLDSHRKLTVIRFLYQSKLIVNERPVLSLHAADLTGINFNNVPGIMANLPNGNFDGAYLTESQLKESILTHAYMRDTNLVGAQLQATDFEHADLSQAQLGSTTGFRSQLEPLQNVKAADLSGANLTHATLTNAFLHKIDMTPLRVNIPASQLRDGGRTNLSDANLRYAYMEEADLRGTILDDADFTCADLAYATFEGATGITKEQLANQAMILSGATMPDGSTYFQQQPTLRWCPGPVIQ